ncbi:MAG TPA: glycosyltransferase [Balneolaceae bacterium]|nr:glycosyltransferase [Balneolaceae bacterium]
MLYSVIIPVYNRPDEIRELLNSLSLQSYKHFEVLVIEDGSTIGCKNVVEEFKDLLDVHYYFKENSGQGFSRNFGFKRAKGNYFVVFDSDCLVPGRYFQTVTEHIKESDFDFWGGPDKAHPDFTATQKAINFSMTSILTTGGIRGRKKHLGNYHPRSFNMGISRDAFEKSGGYRITRMGEDIELSIRLEKLGFTSAFLEDAYVYHKRRTSLSEFFKQLHFFGRARINIGRFYSDEVKPVHWFPLLFTTGLLLSVLFLLFDISRLPLLIYFIYAISLFTAGLIREKKITVAFLGALAAFIQLSAYAMGFLSEMISGTNNKP